MLGPRPRRSFYVAVSWSGNAQDGGFWEIRRKRKAMGVRLSGSNFPSRHAADQAGRIALEDFLNGLVIERAARPAV
ncbi:MULTISPECIES: hypothetical protein [unclassified Bradyrhizobium]